MHGSGYSTIVISILLALHPGTALAHGPGGHPGLSGRVGSVRFGSTFGRPAASIPPGWGLSNPGWGWLGRPSVFGRSSSGLAVSPFHSPSAAPFWSGPAAPFAVKPDEATVLKGESRMEEQIRGLETQSPEDEGAKKGGGAASDGDRSDWQPL